MTTDTDTNAEIVTEALRLAGVVAEDESATASQNTNAIKALGRMLKGWQNKGYNLWAVASQSVALVADDRDYTMSPARPLQVLSVRYDDTSTERPLEELTRQEYDDIPDKTASGVPTCWHYDRQRESAVLYIWPVPSSVTSETLEITYVRELADVVSGSAVDVPSEWYDAVVYNLASRLSHLYRTTRPDIELTARELLDDALAFDREGSVFFGTEGY